MAQFPRGPIPCLHVPPPQQPFARAAAPTLAGRDEEEVPIPYFPPCSALVPGESNESSLMMRFLFRTVIIPHPLLSWLSSISHRFVGPAPAPQACGYGNAFLGMDTIELLLLVYITGHGHSDTSFPKLTDFQKLPRYDAYTMVMFQSDSYQHKESPAQRATQGQSGVNSITNTSIPLSNPTKYRKLGSLH
jgi:hypothetical protein